jgi:predicted RND superfamily exporter protein
MAGRLIHAVLRARWAVLALLVALTALAGVGALRVGVDNAVEVWFVEDDPGLASYRAFQEVFGNDEVVALAVHDADGLLDADGLARVRRVTDAVAAVDGVARVMSLTTVTDVRGGVDVDGFPILDVGTLVRDGAVDPAVASDPFYAGRLVSADGRTAMLYAQMATIEGVDARRHAVLTAIGDAATGAAGDRPRAAGIGVVYDALNQLSTVDSAVFVGLSYVVIVGVLWVLLGRVGPMLVAMVTVGLGAVWLVGAYGWAGRDINMVTMILPTLVLIIGVSDCVHVLHAVAERAAEAPERPRAELVAEAVGFVFWPCLFNTITTAVGFASLATAPMAVLRDLGVFAAIGLCGAFVLALTLCPIALLAPWAEPTLSDRGRVQRFVDACARLALDRPLPVLAGTVFVTLLGAAGIARIKVDTYSIDYLRPGHVVRQDSDWIEANVGPYTPLEFVVRPAPGLRADDPALLQAVDAWERRMEAHPQVGWATSVSDVVRRLDRALGGPGEVPADGARLEQALLLYTSSPDVDLSTQVDGDWAGLRVTVGIPMLSARDMDVLIDALSAEARLPSGASLEVTGYLPLYVTMMDYIVRSQLSSFGLAFVLIFGLIALLFRDLRLAALAVPANLVPILLTLGAMGWLGIRLDVATVTIGAIVLGLVVDDTVQFLYRYRHERAGGAEVRAATEATVHAVGRSLVVTALVLALGFSVLGFAQIRSVSYFGLLVALALGTGVFGDLLILPAMLSLSARRSPSAG